MTLEPEKSALESLRETFRNIGGTNERGIQAVPFGTPDSTNYYPVHVDSDGHIHVDVEGQVALDGYTPLAKAAAIDATGLSNSTYTQAGTNPGGTHLFIVDNDSDEAIEVNVSSSGDGFIEIGANTAMPVPYATDSNIHVRAEDAIASAGKVYVSYWARAT